MKKSQFGSPTRERISYAGFLLFGVSIIALALDREFVAVLALTASVAAFLLGGLLKAIFRK